MADKFNGITQIIGMIPRGGKFAKSVVNFVHKANQNWPKFKAAIQQIDELLKQGKLKLDGKQKTIFESNKNILKNHEKVTKDAKTQYDKAVKDQQDFIDKSPQTIADLFKGKVTKDTADLFKGWKPSLVERSKARDIYQELVPPKVKYTKEMEAIDEELDALAFGGNKYRMWSEAEKTKKFKSLQAEMEKLINAAKKEDLTKLSLSQINKKSHDLQRRIREIADNPNIKGTVYEGPKADMIKALYDSENAALMNARKVITKKNSELKYGKKYPVLDPENDAFIVIGLDEVGNPIKVSRFTGRFGATKDPKTGELTSSEGTSFYDKWNSKKGKLREEGKEVFHETIDSKGKVIMSNPEYKIPKTERLDIQTEFYTDLSTSDLAKKGFSLKQIDMITKGREARKYLEKTQNPDVNIRMHEQTSTNEIGNIMEDLYTRGDDVYKMSIDEWIKKIPEYFAHGGSVPGFATGGISNLFRERQGFQDGTTMDLKYINPAFDTSEGMLSGVGGFPIVPAAVSGIALALSQKDKDKKVPQKKKGPKLPDPKPPFKIGDLIIDFIVANSRQPTPSEELRLKEILRVAKEKAEGSTSQKLLEDEVITTDGDIEKRANKNRAPTDDEIEDYMEDLHHGGELSWHDFGSTVAELDAAVEEAKAYERQMYDKYKTGKLDKYMSMDAKLERVLSADDADRPSGYDPDEEEEIRAYGDEKDRIAIAKMNEAEERAKAKASGSPWYTDPKTLTPEEELRKEFPGIDDRLIKNILADTNPQRIAEVKQTMREALKMLEKGMSHDDVLKILKDTSRTKQAAGGLIGYATGGVSNLFRRR